MESPKPNMLERLQRADDRTKKNAIIIGAAVIMVIVIAVWLVYFNPVAVPSPIAP